MNHIQKDIQDELVEIAPNLARFRQRAAPPVFAAPPQYFENLADQVLLAVSPQSSAISPQKAISKWQNTRRIYYGIAATFLIATMAVWLVPKTFNSLKTNTSTVAETAPINEEDIKTLIQDSKTDIDADFLTNTLGVTEKELSLNMPENAGDNMNDAIDKYIKESDTTNNL